MTIDETQVKNFLSAHLTNCANYTLTSQDNNLIHEQGIESFLYSLIISSQYKKWQVSPTADIRIKNAIHLSVANSRPLELILPFGGYKLWHQPVYSEVSWSEFFSLSFYSRYVSRIAASYSPGVVFKFLTDDVIINSMSEVPKADIEKYFHSFYDLLSQFAKYSPPNLGFEVFKDSGTPFLPNSTNINDWYTDLTKRRGENKILVSCTPIPESISLGSTPTSITMFWSGMGVLETRTEGLVDRIVSPGIWSEIENLPHISLDSDLIPLHNFSSVKVFPEKFGVGKYRAH